MFWLGQALALVAGLLSIALTRTFIARWFPRAHDYYFDLVLIALLIVGIVIAAREYFVLQADVLKLRKESEPRRLTGAQKDMLARLLEGHPDAVAIVSKVVDTESSDFADDFDSALHSAHWETLRIRNRISSRYGVSVGTVSGTVLPGTKILSDALTAIGVLHDNPTFTNGDASTSPPFQAGVIYLVIAD